MLKTTIFKLKIRRLLNLNLLKILNFFNKNCKYNTISNKKLKYHIKFIITLQI